MDSSYHVGVPGLIRHLDVVQSDIQKSNTTITRVGLAIRGKRHGVFVRGRRGRNIGIQTGPRI